MSDFSFHRLDEHRAGGTDERTLLSCAAPRSPSGKIYQYSPKLCTSSRSSYIQLRRHSTVKPAGPKDG